jgi:hypothetical protein
MNRLRKVQWLPAAIVIALAIAAVLLLRWAIGADVLLLMLTGDG